MTDEHCAAARAETENSADGGKATDMQCNALKRTLEPHFSRMSRPDHNPTLNLIPECSLECYNTNSSSDIPDSIIPIPVSMKHCSTVDICYSSTWLIGQGSIS